MKRPPSKAISADPLNKTAEMILAEPPPTDSGGYFFRAMAWLNFALRNDSPSAIHYYTSLRSAVRSRGPSSFEILVVCGAVSSEAEYKKCLGNTAGYMKAVLEARVKYEPLAAFVREVEALAPTGAPYAYWDLDGLMKAWGIASSYLHFIGLEEYRKPLWIGEAIDIFSSNCHRTHFGVAQRRLRERYRCDRRTCRQRL